MTHGADTSESTNQLKQIYIAPLVTIKLQLLRVV